MSSPQDVGTGAPATKKVHSMPVSILFCPECSNMLYPKEDKDARRLMYQCRTCQHTEEATSNCVYRNILKNVAGDTAGVTQDITHDPTVGDHPTTTDPPPSPSVAPSALLICGCCGQVIMCSDCELNPAVAPTPLPASTDATDRTETPVHSTPPKMYQAELFGGMTAWTNSGNNDEQDTWSSILDEVAELNIDPMEMDFDDDYDMDDWEPEIEDTVLVYGPPNRPLSS